jgi:hypothetical protein
MEIIETRRNQKCDSIDEKVGQGSAAASSKADKWL